MEMLKTHPRGPRVNIDVISECIQACYECARTCTDCADACLGEEDLQKLVRCIRLDQDCADICETTGRIMSRQTEPAADILKSQLETCITACRICGSECQMHATNYTHCRICADWCRRCEDACSRLLSTIELKPLAGDSFYVNLLRAFAHSSRVIRQFIPAASRLPVFANCPIFRPPRLFTGSQAVDYQGGFPSPFSFHGGTRPSRIPTRRLFPP